MPALAGQLVVVLDGPSGVTAAACRPQQVDLRDEEAVGLGLRISAGVSDDRSPGMSVGGFSCEIGVNNEPVLVGVVQSRHIATDGGKRLEPIDHIARLVFADEGRPVLDPYLLGQFRKRFLLLFGAHRLEFGGHAAPFSVPVDSIPASREFAENTALAETGRSICGKKLSLERIHAPACYNHAILIGLARVPQALRIGPRDMFVAKGRFGQLMRKRTWYR